MEGSQEPCFFAVFTSWLPEGEQASFVTCSHRGWIALSWSRKERGQAIRAMKLLKTGAPINLTPWWGYGLEDFVTMEEIQPTHYPEGWAAHFWRRLQKGTLEGSPGRSLWGTGNGGERLQASGDNCKPPQVGLGWSDGSTMWPALLMQPLIE